MPNLWKETKKYEREYLVQKSEELGVTPFYAILLLNRGIDSKEKVKNFFLPSLTDLHDPFLMKDMDLAVNRIDQALNSNHKIWIYGDYDVDGTTSVALMFSFLRQFFTELEYYIPDRETEGYGLSNKAVELAIKQKVDLIITLDCGIRSVDLVKKGQQNGVDFIICDHHEVGSTTPNAIAVLDAKQDDCNYPFNELSACGVGFKLVQALCSFWGHPEEMAYDCLDMVAVSIASDLVPITGENRTLAHFGLQKLATNPTQGLKKIMDLFMKDRVIDITNVVFMIGPRINAAGRLASAKSAVKLLLADSDFDAGKFANDLNKYNVERRALDSTITDEALQLIREDQEYDNKKTTLVYQPHWHKGVVGIVASRLMEHHYKPTIVLTKSGDKIVGSARSIETFDIHDALTHCSEYLEQFGGHKFAAGMSLKPENLDAFRLAFETQASSLTEDDLTRKLLYETELKLSAVKEKLYENLQKFGPFGPNNMRPVFRSNNVFDTGGLRTMGAGSKHLKLNIVSSNSDKAIGATAFGFGHLYQSLKKGKRFDVLYTIEENNYKGNSTLELMVKDILVRD